MQNMGTWNSTMVLVFGCFFAFPFFMLLLKEIAAVWPRPATITKIKYVQSPPQIVYKTNTETKVVFKTPRVKKSSNLRKKKFKKPVSVTKTKTKPTPFSPVQTDAVGALVSIGMKKSEANQAVLLKYDPCKHMTFESLFRDCLS
jgi:hypothetical protein